MTIGRRFLLTLFIVLVILLALAAFGYFTGGWEDDDNAHIFGLASAETITIACTDPIMREKIRDLMGDALDRAFQSHVEHMFEVWMKDDRGQPDRARTGVQNGINAYVKASKTVSEWTPASCP